MSDFWQRATPAYPQRGYPKCQGGIYSRRKAAPTNSTHDFSFATQTKNVNIYCFYVADVASVSEPNYIIISTFGSGQRPHIRNADIQNVRAEFTSVVKPLRQTALTIFRLPRKRKM